MVGRGWLTEGDGHVEDGEEGGGEAGRLGDADDPVADGALDGHVDDGDDDGRGDGYAG